MQVCGAEKGKILEDARNHSMTISEYILWLCAEERKRFVKPKDDSGEIWRPVTDFEDLYQVSNLGRIRTLRTNKVLTNKNVKNYFSVRLFKDGLDTQRYVHRIVAQAFIPNPNGFREVNHKDENPHNNNVENLEWCTRKYNANYGTAQERRIAKFIETTSSVLPRPVLKKNLDGDVIERYPSIKEAAIKNNVFHQNVQACCAGKQKTCHGFIYEYATTETSKSKS
jgi:NUMOD4 motif./HNH endonuclease.